MATVTTKARPKARAKSAAGKKKVFTQRNIGVAAAIVGGVAAVGAGIFFAREQTSEKPDYTTLASEGEFEIRDYPALLVAETVTSGADRKAALEAGFHVLADYIFAKSRDGEKIAMTAPVFSGRETGGDTDAGQGWRTRFVMPAQYTRDTLPPAPPHVTISEVPARRVAAARFGGMGSSETLEKKESALRKWLAERGETDTGTVEYAFYNSPMIPGPLRRNEVLVPLVTADENVPLDN